MQAQQRLDEMQKHAEELKRSAAKAAPKFMNRIQPQPVKRKGLFGQQNPTMAPMKNRFSSKASTPVNLLGRASSTNLHSSLQITKYQQVSAD